MINRAGNKKHLKLFIQLLACTIGFWMIFTQCQEPYFNDNLNANEKIPVFNGIITNYDVLNSFSLSYAKPYTSQTSNNIEGAIIKINDNSNNIIQLDEPTPGSYSLPNGSNDFEIGKKYFATIELMNGDVFRSENISFRDTLPLSNLYFEFNINTSVTKNNNGDFITVSEEGIFVKFKLERPLNEVSYYRSNANYYVHSQKWVNRVKEYIVHEPHYDIVYEIHSDTLYDIYEGYANTNFPIIGELNPTIEYSTSDLTLNPIFLPADNECRNFSRYTSNQFIEWVIPVDLYHSSETVHNYYVNAALQLEASGQIFDPIPNQLLGNIINETHAEKPILGIFDVASVNRKYIAIYVYESLGYRSYQSKILTDTVIKQGWYANQFYIDTVFKDSIPINGN